MQNTHDISQIPQERRVQTEGNQKGDIKNRVYSARLDDDPKQDAQATVRPLELGRTIVDSPYSVRENS